MKKSIKTPTFLVVIPGEFQRDEDKEVGYFNFADGLTDEKKTREGNSIIRLYDGYLKNDCSPKNIKNSFIEICICNVKGDILTCVSGAAHNISFRSSDNVNEVLLTGCSLPFVSKDALSLWMKKRHGFPNIKGEWLRLSSHMREAWLEVAALSAPQCSYDRENIKITLDGNRICNLSSFLCALGEEIHGPGGYMGRSLGALEDCLFGGFGVKMPMKVTWKNSEFSKARFEKSGQISLYCEIISVLKQNGVDLHLL